MQTIINAHARQRDRYIHRRRGRRVTHKVRRVGGIGVGVLAAEVALAAEAFVAASMAPVWFSLMSSLCKPCGGRDDLFVQEVPSSLPQQVHRIHASASSHASSSVVPHAPLPRTVAETLGCEGSLRQSHQEAKGRVQTKQRGPR